jgi:hypothetical protein
MECYFPLLEAAGIDYSVLDSAEVFLVAATIIRDDELTKRAVATKLVAACLPSGSHLETIKEMNEGERAALRDRIIAVNSWLRKKLARP